MGVAEATAVVITTSRLDDANTTRVRALLDASFRSFSDDDWHHALGGRHALVRDGGEVVAHAALVPRRMVVAGRPLRCGYVEAVAVAESRRRAGLGGLVMDELEALAVGYDVLLLCASRDAVGFYLARGWQVWRGPTSVLHPDGVRATPEEDGNVYVLGARGAGLDVDLPIACDWRDGDVW